MKEQRSRFDALRGEFVSFSSTSEAVRAKEELDKQRCFKEKMQPMCFQETQHDIGYRSTSWKEFQGVRFVENDGRDVVA